MSFLFLNISWKNYLDINPECVRLRKCLPMVGISVPRGSLPLSRTELSLAVLISRNATSTPKIQTLAWELLLASECSRGTGTGPRGRAVIRGRFFLAEVIKV